MSAIEINREAQTPNLFVDMPKSGLDIAPAVSVSHISKTYPVPFARLRRLVGRPCLKPIEALTDVSFKVGAGEIFGLIGSNGAGKTTLIKIIATLVQPTSGKVTVQGYDSVREGDDVRTQIGLAPAEERSFYWRLTVIQNLMFFARLYGMSDVSARQRIRELLARFELEDVARRRFGELSTGNKQRMALARALLGDPPVLLLDEPTRSLDPLAAASMRSLIRDLAQQHPPISILLTSHNLHEVEELCSRVAIISRGQIRALDSPQNLRDQYRETERVQFIVRRIGRAQVEHLLTQELEDLDVVECGDNLSITFTRETYDDRLNMALGILRDNAVSILACNAEGATLFDVMKSYEHNEMICGSGRAGC